MIHFGQQSGSPDVALEVICHKFGHQQFLKPLGHSAQWLSRSAAIRHLVTAQTSCAMETPVKMAGSSMCMPETPRYSVRAGKVLKGVVHEWFGEDWGGERAEWEVV